MTTRATPTGPAPAVGALPGPHLCVVGRQVPAYRLFGLTGLLAGVATAMAIAAVTGVPLTAVAAVAVVGLIVAVGVVALRTALSAGDLVWSEQEVVVLVVAGGVGAAFSNVRGVLDAVAVGLVLVLACGRLGCLLAGCCHGRPAKAGARLAVQYSHRHAALGFPVALVGTPLVPVQAVEALWGVLVAAAGAAVAAGAGSAGATLAAVIGARTAGRTVFETLRGDEGRFRHGPATTPQYWALGAAVVLLAATAASLLPAGWWTVAPAITVVLFAAVTFPTMRSADRARSSPGERCGGIWLNVGCGRIGMVAPLRILPGTSCCPKVRPKVTA